MRRVQLNDALGVIPAGAYIEAVHDEKNADSANPQYMPADLFASAAQGDLATSALQPEDLDTFAELQALVADGAVLQQTDINTLAKLNAIIADATLVDTADNRLGVAVAAGLGLTAGSGFLQHSSVEKIGDFFKTTIYVDMTGLKSSTTDLDIIGVEGADLAVNGAFAADSDWTLGADWSIAGGVAIAAPGAGTIMEPEVALVPIIGDTYEVTFTMSGYVAGALVGSFGGTNLTSRGSNATFVERIVAADATNFKFTSDAASDYDIDDVIIKHVGPAFLVTLSAAINGTIFRGQVTWLETPTTGADDIIFYSADEASGIFDAGIAGLTGELVLYNKGSAAAGAVATPFAFALLPTVAQSLYLVNGEAATVGTYDAGIFVIELWGV